MSIRSWAWALGLWWLVPVQVLASVLFIGSSQPVEQGYGLAHQVLGSQSIVLTAPFAGLAAATISRRLASAHLLRRPRGRSWLRVWWTVVGPLAAVTAAVNAAVQIMVADAPIVGWSWGPLVGPAVWGAASSAIGAVVGAWLPLRLSAPIVLLIPYLLLAFPPAMYPLWLRHLVGSGGSCCQIYEVLSWRVLLSSALTASTIAAMGYLGWRSIVAPRRSQRRVLLGAAPAIVIAVIVAVSLVSGMGPTAVSAREDGMQCLDSGLRVCVWPEHKETVENADAEIRAVHAIALQTSLPTPTELVERNPLATTWPQQAFGVREGADPVTVQRAVVSALLPQPDGECLARLNGGDRADSGTDYDILGVMTQAWWQQQLGQTPPQVADATSPYRDSVLRLLALSPQDSGDVLTVGAMAVRSCAALDIDTLIGRP